MKMEIAFAAGLLAGIANYGVRKPSTTTVPQDSQPFNPGSSPSYTGAPGIGTGSGAAPGLGQMFGGTWDGFMPFPEGDSIMEGVNDQISSGTWTQQMAWTSYELDNQGQENWVSWDQYVDQLNTIGIDFSGFDAPPGGNTPPGGTTTTPSGSGQSNPGWMHPGIDPGLVP